MDETEQCGNCRYGKPTNFTNTYGHEIKAVYCRYNPPTETEPHGFSPFPKMHPSNWCGKWQGVVTPAVISETKEWADGKS